MLLPQSAQFRCLFTPYGWTSSSGGAAAAEGGKQ